MPAHNLNKKTINLLVLEGFEHSPVGKVLHWLLSAGRTIVIFTELIVIISFLSRFWLDRTLTDLSEQNNNKRAQIEASRQFEENFKSVQQRLSLVNQIQAASLPSTQLTRDISSILPESITLSEIIITEERQLLIRGTSLSESAIAGLMVGLENSKKFKDIALSDISLDTRGTQVIKFAIRVNLIQN